jgi:hypothetical protein
LPGDDPRCESVLDTSIAVSPDGGGGVFALAPENAVAYLLDRGLLDGDRGTTVTELAGGVSATVIAVRAPGAAVVVKQALRRLKVEAEWIAKQDRTEVEAAALRLCGRLTPGRVPQVLLNDPPAHVVVMELLPDEARNWQSEIGEGRVHEAVGSWAGETLGTWHRRTAGDPAVAAEFDDFESFEQLRLRPFYETAIANLPHLAADLGHRLGELRGEGRCFVDGDFAMKNMLVAPGRSWKLDFEVVHYGNPVFDLGFFLSFVLLSALRWPELTTPLRHLADRFLAVYHDVAGPGFAGDFETITAHTACLVLARTDGKSPASFLDPPSRSLAREAGTMMLRDPERGLWQWL